MTQQPLCFDAPTRDTLTDRMAALFRSRAGEWLDILPLAQTGGMGGWRTEVSRCRQRFGMIIEQRMEHWPDGRNRSQYRYVAGWGIQDDERGCALGRVSRPEGRAG